MSVQDMIADLEEYYENAGFADFYERALKGKNDEEIIQLYKDTFENDELINGEKQEFENTDTSGNSGGYVFICPAIWINYIQFCSQQKRLHTQNTYTHTGKPGKN